MNNQKIKEAMKLRTLQEVEHLGAMLQTILQNKEQFHMNLQEETEIRAALQVLYWMVNEPSIPDLIGQTETVLRAHGFEVVMKDLKFKVN